MLLPDGEYATRAATGNGPVEAIFSAINDIVDANVKLLEYSVHAVSGGVDTLGEVSVLIGSALDSARTYRGHGANTDVLVASARAYVSAVNKLLRVRTRKERPRHKPAVAAVGSVS